MRRVRIDVPLFRFTTAGLGQVATTDPCAFADIGAARSEAVRFTAELVRETGADVFRRDLHVIVTDDAGRLCWHLTLEGREGPGARG